MARSSLTERLFVYLWHRYVEGCTDEDAAAAAGVSREEFLRNRSRRTVSYRAAEAMMEKRLPDEALARYARALQARLLLNRDDSAGAQVAKTVLDGREASDAPTAITFVIQDAETREAVEEALAPGRGRSRGEEAEGDEAEGGAEEQRGGGAGDLRGRRRASGGDRRPSAQRQAPWLRAMAVAKGLEGGEGAAPSGEQSSGEQAPRGEASRGEAPEGRGRRHKQRRRSGESKPRE